MVVTLVGVVCPLAAAAVAAVILSPWGTLISAVADHAFDDLR